MKPKTIPLEEIPAPPDGGWGWVVCFASFLCNMILDGIAYSFGILLGPLVIYFDSNRSTVSWVGSLLCGIYMASGPIVGGLVNKFGCRPVCIAGAIFSCLSLVLSTFSTNVGVLMLTYGIMGGFGLGCIYLPAVVACGYYFEKKRALATGIAVCGSGVGCFVFAPFANYLLDLYGWKGANMIFAALCFNCAICGSLMRPLELVITTLTPNSEPTTLPEITIDTEEEETNFFQEIPEDEELEIEMPEFFDNNKLSIDHKRDRTISESVRMKSIPKSPSRSDMMKRNRSTPGLGRLARLDSMNEREVMQVLDRRNSSYLVYEVQNGSQQVLKPSVSRRNSKAIIRPMSRKDIFYSGSVYNLALDMSEEKRISDNSLKGYRQSIVSIPRNGTFAHRGSVVACHLSIPSEEILDPELLKEKIETTNPIMNVLKEMLDFDIMLNPLFALICISNIFGFLAVYVPYVYLPNMTHQRGISSESAAFIISMIGVSNTVGRVIIGAFVDLPWVSSLVVTNISLIMSGVCLFIFPFCYDYTSFILVALMLGLFVSAFISLTSIVLVDLLGLDSLTSSFGMLVLCRGIASILGPPLAGLVFDWSQDYSASFYMAGAFFVFGGLLSFIAYFMDRRKKTT